MKSKYYVVWKGHNPGIYTSWSDCKKEVENFQFPKFKSFPTEQEAKRAYKEPFRKHIKRKRLPSSDKPIKDSICVDAACNTVTGQVEYQSIYTKDKRVIFKKGPFQDGTNNIGEFLAIVETLMYCKATKCDLPIYSDSYTAIIWVINKKINTSKEETLQNIQLFDKIHAAIKWLKENKNLNQVLKWRTKQWGEIPADYGRK